MPGGNGVDVADKEAADKEHKDLSREFTSAEIGALAHLYRGEVYRSTLWRQRLDTTTNWSVVTLGIAVSVSFSSAEASPIPLMLVGLLVLFFLLLEARRYRYFNVWRARARWMEEHFYAPMLEDGNLHGAPDEEAWQHTLARDYHYPRYHISYIRAFGRRLRRSYVWILAIQTIAYIGKIMVHPGPVGSLSEFIERAAVGPVSGEIVLLAGILYNGSLLAIAIYTYFLDSAKLGGRGTLSMG